MATEVRNRGYQFRHYKTYEIFIINLDHTILKYCPDAFISSDRVTRLVWCEVAIILVLVPVLFTVVEWVRVITPRPNISDSILQLAAIPVAILVATSLLWKVSWSSKRPTVPTQVGRTNKVPLLPGYLHDVESLWWLALWELANKVSLVTKQSTPPDEFSRRLGGRAAEFYKILDNSGLLDKRSMLFSTDYDYYSPKLIDPHFREAAEILGIMRSIMIYHYVKEENKPEFPLNLLHPPMLGLYLDFNTYLQGIAASKVNGGVENWMYN